MSIRLPVILDSFNTGVVAEEVRRINAKFYSSSLAKCDNGIITQYGNIRKRPGTKYIANIVCNKQRMIPFVYSETQAYILLFITDHNNVSGDDRIYFLTLDGFVTDGSGNPYYITHSFANPENIQYVQKDDVMYLAYDGALIYKLTRVSESNWTLTNPTFTANYRLAYGDGVTLSFRGAIPKATIGSFDLLTISSISYTIKGTAYSATESGGVISGTNIKGSYDSSTGEIYVEAIKTGANTWTASTAYAVGDLVIPTYNSKYYFECTTAGTSGASEPVWLSNTETTDNSVKWTPHLIDAFDSGTPVMVVLADHSAYNTKAITIYQDRLIRGFDSGTFWASVVGNYENFTLGANDNDSYIYTVSSNEDNSIKWMHGTANALIIATEGSIFIATGGNTGITTKNVSISELPSYGANTIQPLSVGYALFYIHTYNQRLYKTEYNWQAGGYIVNDMNLLNHDILNSNVIAVCREREPYNRLWLLKADGTVAILSLLQEQGIFAWQSYSTNGTILAIGSIPAITDAFDKVYMVVDRGGTKYIEATDNPIYTAYFDTGFSDCYTHYIGAATSTITVPFADGDTVSVFTDKGTHPDVTVSGGQVTLQSDVTVSGGQSGGQVTLQWDVTEAIIGYKYALDAETVPIEIVGANGSTVGKMKSLQYLRLNLVKSIDGAVGMANENTLLYLTSYTTTGQPLPLFTGMKAVRLFNAYTKRQIAIRVLHDSPTPFNLIGLSFDMEVGEI